MSNLLSTKQNPSKHSVRQSARRAVKGEGTGPLHYRFVSKPLFYISAIYSFVTILHVLFAFLLAFWPFELSLLRDTSMPHPRGHNPTNDSSSPFWIES